MMVALALLELSSLSGSRVTMGLTTAVFFAVFGVLLIACAWLVTRGQTWARGPILMAQLIGLGLAWNLRGGQTTPVAIGLAVVAAIVIAGLLHPASVEALNPEGERS
ncbi:MAG: hypothetical protein JWN68_1882 [Nocardioides sp.]|jgi:hypothetical protein|nr:hypothetical protein [Nocardioides sp.]